MYTAILVLHVFVSIFLVSVVLLQAGRGADLGAAFGSVGQSTFARGTTTFMSKVTTALAVIFMVTSMTLAFMTTERPGQSIIEPVAAEPAPGTQSGANAPPIPSPLEQADAPAAQPLEQAGAPASPPSGGPLEPSDAPPREQQ